MHQSIPQSNSETTAKEDPHKIHAGLILFGCAMVNIRQKEAKHFEHLCRLYLIFGFQS